MKPTRPMSAAMIRQFELELEKAEHGMASYYAERVEQLPDMLREAPSCPARWRQNGSDTRLARTAADPWIGVGLVGRVMPFTGACDPERKPGEPHEG